MKKCNCCGIKKDLFEFANDKTKKDRHRGECRDCEKEKRRIRYQKNIEVMRKRSINYRLENKTIVQWRDRKRYFENKEIYSIRNMEYRENNKEKITNQQKGYRIENKEKIYIRQKKYTQSNKVKIAEYQKEYNEKNHTEITKKKRSYYLKNRDKFLDYRKNYAEENKDNINKNTRERYNSDIKFKISNTLRRRFSNIIYAIKTKKILDTFQILGCDIDFFIKHIENQFQNSMTWGNHGRKGWNLDHIRPCASFDLTDPAQQKECFHYTNLQPLWAFDNLSKGSLYNGKRYRHRIAV